MGAGNQLAQDRFLRPLLSQRLIHSQLLSLPPHSLLGAVTPLCSGTALNREHFRTLLMHPAWCHLHACPEPGSLCCPHQGGVYVST